MSDNPNISPYRVLIVDDDEAHAEMIREFLRISGIAEVEHAPDLHSMWSKLELNQSDKPYDILLLDYKLPDGTGLDGLDQLSKKGYQIPVVMVTGQGNERVAVQAIQRGAADYLMKSGEYLVTLPTLINKTIHAHQLRLSVQRSLEQIRYQAMMLNNVRDAVVAWDMNGLITFWNPAATGLFGWNIDERLGREVSQVYLSAFTPAIQFPKDGDSIGRPVIRKYINPRGKTIWVSSRVTALYDGNEQNRLLGYMDVSHDITGRVEAEQALRESEARYRAIVDDYQTELICRFKPNGILSFVNEVYSQYFGKSRDELVGMNILSTIAETDRQRVGQHLASFGPQKNVATLEHMVIVPDKGLRWISRTDRAILDKEGHVLEFQCVARDITDRKRLEAQIQAAQAHLVHSARLATIGEMASGVAHQIYNPLTTIIADAQILLRSLPSKHAGRDSAEAIEQAGWRLQNVVQRLLEFSRPESETLTPVSINDTIRNAITLVSPHIETIGCKLEYSLDEFLPTVSGNPNQLENLWANLLLLARDACMDNRSHHIRVQSGLDAAGVVMVEVVDDGKHIPDDQLVTIFEPNFIGPTSGRGSGMELSVCREIVRQHGGQIIAKSKEGGETVFRVTLPGEA